MTSTPPPSTPDTSNPLPTPEQLPLLVSQLWEAVEMLTARQQAGEIRPWLTVEDPNEARELFAELVGWLHGVWAHYPGPALPDCWFRHSWVIEELNACRMAWLGCQRRGAVPAAFAEWHRSVRPGTQQRIQQALSACDLHEDHPVQRPALPEPDDPDDVVLPWTGNRDEPSQPDL